MRFTDEGIEFRSYGTFYAICTTVFLVVVLGAWFIGQIIRAQIIQQACGAL